MWYESQREVLHRPFSTGFAFQHSGAAQRKCVMYRCMLPPHLVFVLFGSSNDASMTLA
jgi:hypothetical protein